MCYNWKFPSDPYKEIGIEVYEKLPFMQVVNVTGGEPFIREDLDEIVTVLRKKTKRLVISSNGFFTKKIVDLFRKHKDIGIRVSLEGLQKTNDELRGIAGGFNHGIKTLTELQKIGIRDIGFGVTLCDRNAGDLLELYKLAREMKVEFASAAIHNSFYFHKFDNKFTRQGEVIKELSKLVNELLKSRKVKDWFRAYFNYGLINYIKGNPRLLPCQMGENSFFLDPYGQIFPCNVMEESMGNLKEDSFDRIWRSGRAKEIRALVKNCRKNCWMVGSVSQQMKKYFWDPLFWVFSYKFLKRRVKI